MCAIAGCLFFQPSLVPIKQKTLLGFAIDKMKSRGPDETHYFLDRENGLGFGHNRLKIIDQSATGSQPFVSVDRRFVIVFNGEIYNYRELKLQLQALGYKFLGKCDTEVLLAAYIFWGKEALPKLRGMFSFAIFDYKLKKLILVRDRFGIKPLYFTSDERGVFFASQLDALEILQDRPVSVSEFSLYHYLQLMAVPAPLTIYKNLFKVPAGCLVEIESGRLRFERWYNVLQNIDQVAGPVNFAQAQAQLDVLITESVKQHTLSSDVPVAIFLSGGVDSGLVAKLAAQYSKITAFHLVVRGQSNSELSAARKIAQKFNFGFVEVVATVEDFAAASRHFTARVDDLVADPVCISFSILAKAASRRGFKVVLLGEGADELFWGYDLYQKHRSVERIAPLVKSIPGLCNYLSRKYFSGYKSEVFSRLAQNKPAFLSGAISFLSFELVELKKRCEDNLADFSQQLEMIRNFWGDPVDPMEFTSWGRGLRRGNVRDSTFWFTYQELLHRLPELLLMRCDKAGMLYGVEARVPFLDHKIVEFALSLPLKMKIGAGIPKYLLKLVAQSHLQSSAVWNKKVGFSAPLLSLDLFRMRQVDLPFIKSDLSLVQSWTLHQFLEKKFILKKTRNP